MKFKISHLLLSFFAMIIGFVPQVVASPTVIRSQMGAEVLMGDTILMHLEVVRDKGANGVFPEFQELDASSRVIVCNDSVELGKIVLTDSIDLGSDRVQLNYTLPVQCFYPGLYHVPGVRYAVGNDTVQSEGMALNVTPLAVAENDDIRGYADIAEAPDGPWTDSIPDFFYYYGWLIILLVVVLAVLIWLYIKFRKTGKILPQKPKLTPYELAVWQLHKLKEKKLWETGREKEYYSDLTEILRTYIHNRFGLNAMEMTTSQLLAELQNNSELLKHKDEIISLLQDADFVKFAKETRGQHENISAFNDVARFVEQTRPEPQDNEAKESGNPGKGGEK